MAECSTLILQTVRNVYVCQGRIAQYVLTATFQAIRLLFWNLRFGF